MFISNDLVCIAILYNYMPRTAYSFSGEKQPHVDNFLKTLP